MSRSFGAGEQRLAGMCARMLGWRPGEFWEATPAELATILAPEGPDPAAPLSRDELNRLMEREHV